MDCEKKEVNESSMQESRIDRVRSLLSLYDVEGIFFFDASNIRYITGFTGTDGALFVDGKRVLLLVDGRYTTQAGNETTGCDIITFRDRTACMADIISDLKLSSVGVESTAIVLSNYLALRDRVGKVSLKPLSGKIERIRMVKDGGEIALLRQAAVTAARALEETLEYIKPGITEKDVAVILERKLRQAGGENPSFETIAASGVNSALPHAVPGSRKIQHGDFLTIDYGTISGGYHSDETCTFGIGSLTEKQIAVYDIVKEAHDKAIRAVKPGISCAEIDGIARAHITEAGYGEYFSHGTGHGVGLNVHEPPRVYERSEDVLEEGIVITIEPGIYIPGLWGVRIEDTILVGRDGCEIITKMYKDLRIL